ncbi:gamma carbonic anhydrase family protein [Streptomyces sp. DSM 44917]|uniref:Gamma carbonic anhydrase family protein n=2 Tax=Streptomyces boetiae TaxID=3075541 RepID=A0ABU2L952_9ACTN|nr:gamma carbonic anhydrase family protein [Streptomyces sp. DSM 44917]MDT0308095.1 gamma carbonic anhydrase family protein [Streptomyces sp. DSM 44917]
MTMTVAFEGREPRIHPGAWVAPNATVVGDVSLADEASLWYTAVARADAERIEIGGGTNVQDGCVLHADPGFPALIGAGVSIGHRAVVHGCTVEDDVLIGMGSVLLNGSHVGAGSLIAAGTVLLEGFRVPPGSLVAGVPGKVRRPLTEEELAVLRLNAEHYRDLARRHAAAL